MRFSCGLIGSVNIGMAIWFASLETESQSVIRKLSMLEEFINPNFHVFYLHYAPSPQCLSPKTILIQSCQSKLT